MSPNKLAIAVGWKADGSLSALYVGMDATKAREAFAAAGPEFVEVRCFRQLRHVWKRRKGSIVQDEAEAEESEQSQIPVTGEEETPAEEIPIEGAIDEAAALVGGPSEATTEAAPAVDAKPKAKRNATPAAKRGR